VERLDRADLDVDDAEVTELVDVGRDVDAVSTVPPAGTARVLATIEEPRPPVSL
jgi:hypothetical protein